MLIKALLITGGYLVGAIPFGVLISKFFYNVDIRQHGSKNTGATNVWRVLGKKPGLITLGLDILKGTIPVLIARAVLPEVVPIAVLTGLAAIIGHNWSIFLMGSGGKGVATSAGVCLALLPIEAVIALVTFGIFFLLTRYVSVGSMAGSVALASTTLARDKPASLRAFAIVAAAMVIIRHIPNIKRLARGEENKVQFR